MQKIEAGVQDNLLERGTAQFAAWQRGLRMRPLHAPATILQCNAQYLGCLSSLSAEQQYKSSV